jgi:RES domain-containing protein
MAAPARRLREPLERPAFDALAIPHRDAHFNGWVSLRYRTDATLARLLFENPASRLTPPGVPCIYLAPTEAVSFWEINGDQVYAARLAHKTFRVAASELKARVFVQFGRLRARVADLSDATTRSITGLDSASLYVSHVTLPKLWATRFHNHPAGFDGIMYRSRHTDDPCVVLWRYQVPAITGLRFNATASLWDRLKPVPARPTDMTLFGEPIVVR